MTERMNLVDAEIVAGLGLVRSRSVFCRHDVIISKGGDIARVRKYVNDSEADVEKYVSGLHDVNELVAYGMAVDLKSNDFVPARSGAALWLVRAHTPERDRFLDELLGTGAVAHECRRHHYRALDLFIVVEGDASSAFRTRWRDRYVDMATSFLKRGSFNRAHAQAQAAHAFALGLDPTTLALMSLSAEGMGDHDLAQIILCIAKDANDPKIEAATAAELERLKL